MTDLPSKAVRELLYAAAPERETELSTLWEEYEPQIRLIGDKPNFSLQAGGFGSLAFTGRTMRIMWLLAFATRDAAVAYMAPLATAIQSQRQLDEQYFSSIPDQQEAEERYSTSIASVRELESALGEADFLWPASVPVPSPDLVIDAVEEKAAFDLCCLASAFSFLHEVKHLIHRKENRTFPDHIEEEFECDRFARDFLTSRIDQYCQETGEPRPLVLQKRCSGIGMAAFFLLAVTPVHLWGGTEKHPPVRERLKAALKAGEELEEMNAFWLTVSSWLVSHLREESRLRLPLAAFDLRELTYLLVDQY